MLKHRAFLHTIDTVGKEHAVAQLPLEAGVGAQLEHRPRHRYSLAAGIGDRAGVGGDAEGVGYRERRHAIEATDRQAHRRHEPVVAEGKREFGDRYAQQIGDASLGAGKADIAVLELPVALGRHAGVANR